MWRVSELSLLVSTSLVTVHIVTLFLLFLFQVSLPGEHAYLSKVDDFWQHHWPIRPSVGKTGNAGDNHLTVRETLLFIEYSHFVHYDVVM